MTMRPLATMLALALTPTLALALVSSIGWLIALPGVGRMRFPSSSHASFERGEFAVRRSSSRLFRRCSAKSGGASKSPKMRESAIRWRRSDSHSLGLKRANDAPTKVEAYPLGAANMDELRWRPLAYCEYMLDSAAAGFGALALPVCQLELRGRERGRKIAISSNGGGDALCRPREPLDEERFRVRSLDAPLESPAARARSRFL